MSNQIAGEEGDKFMFSADVLLTKTYFPAQKNGTIPLLVPGTPSHRLGTASHTRTSNGPSSNVCSRPAVSSIASPAASSFQGLFSV